MASININKASPASIVLPHYALGAIAFLTLSVLMFISADSFIGHYFNPKLLALTHIATLGWATMIIFGALYQFLPVILLTHIYSVRLARITFFLFTAGIVLLIYSFWTFSVGYPIQIAASVLFIATSLFTINIIATSQKSKEDSIEADFIVSACMWFWITVLLGLLMAFNFQHVFLAKEHLYYLKIHAHIGIAGWFLLLIIGVSSKLIPMFLLSSNIDKKRLKFSFYIINGTLLIFFLDAFLFNGIDRGLLYFIAIITGLVYYISFLSSAYKKRVKKGIDLGMKQSMIAFFVLAFSVLIGTINNSDIIHDPKYSLQLTLAFGVSVLLGFISLLILGQTFKTLPFIVWLKLSNEEGKKQKPPLPKALYSERMLKWQFILFIIAVVVLIAGINFSLLPVIRIACILLIAAAVSYNLNVFKLLIYKNK